MIASGAIAPGRVLLQVRARFGHGLGTAWYRDVVRPRILGLPPVRGLDDRSAEIHVLTSAGDWLNLVWTLRSFYRVSPRRLALCIHGDPGLPAQAAAELARHFPEARIVLAEAADRAVLPGLAANPRAERLRRTNTLARKVFDFRHFLEADRLALFDSDLMFFAPPTAFLAHLDEDRPTNLFNADIATAYAVPPDRLEALGFAVQRDINSGFGIVHRASLDLDWIEEFLAVPGMLDGHFWRIEQTLFALTASRHGVELLPEPYRVYTAEPLGDRPFRHYVGAVRHLFYAQGIRLLHRALLGETRR